MRKSVLFTTFSLVLLHQLASHAAKERTLVFTSVLYRHGDRSPIHILPKDPTQAAFWKRGLGQLTRTGMVQQYHLGEFLHQRYEKELEAKFIFDNYTRTQLYVRSTDVDRTLMSAQCQLAGLFKPGESQSFLADLNWQPIPVHTVPTSEDYLLHPENCPRYDQLMDSTRNSKQYRDVETENKDFFSFLSAKTGYPSVDLSLIGRIYESAYIDANHNRSLIWVNQTVLDSLQELNNIRYQFNYNSLTKRRLKGGLLVGAVLADMKSMAKDNVIKEKLRIYSAHDSTVAAFLSALGVWDRKAPDFCSTILVELYRLEDQRQMVEVWYKFGPLVGRGGELYCNSSSATPFTKSNECLQLLTLPGCRNSSCTLDEFQRSVSSVIPKDIVKECQLPSDTTTDMSISIGLGACAVGLFLINTVVVVALISLFLKRQRHHHTNSKRSFGKRNEESLNWSD